ncbi:hypothetical protein DPMN_172967 [Dreissena polymorpha]|uniref:Uncharacterized protein n=1 Tax=Dreissena polymorpha TaxID=45954 RepID=A0A9D4E3A6_DREPO|nr:hypothetical protein DPMN_172967 [Dreissena polymorpha]
MLRYMSVTIAGTIVVIGHGIVVTGTIIVAIGDFAGRYKSVTIAGTIVARGNIVIG